MFAVGGKHWLGGNAGCAAPADGSGRRRVGRRSWRSASPGVTSPAAGRRDRTAGRAGCTSSRRLTARQAPASGDVPVDVRLDDRPRRALAAGLARVRAVGAPREARDHRPARARRRPARPARSTPPTCSPGLTTVEAIAASRRRWSHDGHDHDGSRRSRRPRPRPRARIEHVLVGAGGRPRDRGPLRRPRAGEVPHAVPERLLHRSRRHDGRPAGACTSTRRRCRPTPAACAIDPTEWNRNDGFSPGSMIVTYVAGLDLAASGAAPITDIGASLRPGPADRAARHRHRAALAVLRRARRAGRPARPARARSSGRRSNLIEGHRYVVALRNLRDASGAPIAAGPRLPALPRPHPDVHARRSRRGGRTSSASSTTSTTPGVERARPVPRLGLHGGERAEPRRPDAAHPRRRVRQPARRRPRVHGRPGREQRRRPDLPPGDRHLHRSRTT